MNLAGFSIGWRRPNSKKPINGFFSDVAAQCAGIATSKIESKVKVFTEIHAVTTLSTCRFPSISTSIFNKIRLRENNYNIHYK